MDILSNKNMRGGSLFCSRVNQFRLGGQQRLHTLSESHVEAYEQRSVSTPLLAVNY